MASHYNPSLITGEAEHQALAAGLVVGIRVPSSPVVRLADAKPMQLAVQNLGPRPRSQERSAVRTMGGAQ